MKKRVPQLDAIRGVAALLVLFHNTDLASYAGIIARNGWMGVDLFFVLSGFLITGILLETKRSENYFRAFYARRCLRIWPLYLCSLLFMFVIVPVIRPSEAHRVFDTASMPWWSYLLFLQNFFVPVITRASGLLAVTWSVAVEEQFYLVWPFVVRYCNERQLRNLSISLVCFSPLLRLYLMRHGVEVYSNTFCRLDGLMLGSLLSILTRSEAFNPRSHVRYAWLALLIAAPLALITAVRSYSIVFSFSAFASAALVYLALFSEQRLLQAILRNRFLVYTGVISYGIYLLEKIPIDAVPSLGLPRLGGFDLLITVVATYALAILSWNLLEKPSLRLKRHFPLSSRGESASLEPVAVEAS